MSAIKGDAHREADQATRNSFVNNLLKHTIFVPEPHPPNEEAIMSQVYQTLSTSKDDSEISDNNNNNSLFFSKVSRFQGFKFSPFIILGS